ncbi:MAG TPA: FkbM family methyltransferase [Sphingomicrobium sp.]|jgi:FkbM family methyltransferase
MELIYDVGVENGDDSAYYLHKGFRVVGVEASPVAVEKLRSRFAAEIVDGRYVLLAVAIASETGQAPFWVCDDHPPWSSFDRDIAARNGCGHHEVQVETRTFASILQEFGRAAYCKIDIEGNDDLCLAAFSENTRARYVSVELIDGDEQLRLLRDNGYCDFKLISQRSFRQPSPALLRLKAKLPQLARLPISKAEALVRHQPEPDWRFRGGSSGPFGEATAGPWQGFDEALDMWRAIADLGNDLSDWHDIHARLGG